jgi:hypothetical protein
MKTYDLLLRVRVQTDDADEACTRLMDVVKAAGFDLVYTEVEDQES